MAESVLASSTRKNGLAVTIRGYLMSDSGSTVELTAEDVGEGCPPLSACKYHITRGMADTSPVTAEVRAMALNSWMATRKESTWLRSALPRKQKGRDAIM